MDKQKLGDTIKFFLYFGSIMFIAILFSIGRSIQRVFK